MWIHNGATHSHFRLLGLPAAGARLATDDAVHYDLDEVFEHMNYIIRYLAQ